MKETISNLDALETTATVVQPLPELAVGSPLPVSWIIGGVVLLVALYIAKKAGWLDRIRVFFLQTREELLKCSWPTREELRGSTWMVLVAVGMLGLFTFMADLLLGGVVIQDWLLKGLGGGAAG
ncbi:MAG: preprotein translocase subunit SecE [Verrucomicrobia bacterium]|jgi:preprotein translocase subunit SecE|nr:preprotein translocase subunit SecE [Verrucomicrobiota bacterium]MBT3913452.1 preprotein translocase subunit SecE [Verrucomicrobiota bacterium]MBT4228230.1 preprotein translocase subunit SecE [Verrucomicrobiota bacterium]MBT7027388.1 preprotein translocase subunit SecE [Verrucomicrobiota bacterium]MBT7910953.1 preprotein translocase subunit SecE [Verrucomicrobiota bacterium]